MVFPKINKKLIMCRYENLYQDNNPKITQTIDFFGEDHLLIALLDILIKY